MAYRAEIEIGVKGARQLREVTNQVETLAERVDLISAYFKPFIQTLGQFESNLSRAATTLKRVRAGTEDETTAVRQYVQALGQANSARARQNNLIQQEIALQEAAKRIIQPGPTGFSRAEFGPALPPSFIRQEENQQNFKRLFADLNETAKAISVSNTNTKTSWQKTFEELNETAKSISVSRLNTQSSWGETFKQLNETAKAIAVSRLNTQSSWQETFKQLNETAKAISVSRLNTQTSWQETFKQLNETSKAISVSRLNTQTSWQQTFKQLNETAKAISLSRLNTQASWQETFKQLNETAKAISVSRLNTQTSWQKTLKELNETAKAISVSRLNVKTSWVKALSDLSETADVISKNAERERRRIRSRERRGTIAAGRERQTKIRDASSNALIGGAFPLLFGQGIGAAAGGALGGGLGGLAGGQFGFGLSLVGTAFGQAFDEFVNKANELGRALDPLNGNVETVISSIGLADTATGRYIKTLEQVAGKQIALEEATKQLALVVGDEGVQALREFGDATKQLQNATSTFVTQILAEAAKLLRGPAKGTADVFNRFTLQRQGLVSQDPRQVLLRTQLRNAAGPVKSQEVLEQIVELQRKINEEAAKETQQRANSLDPSKRALATSQRGLEIRKLGNNVLNDNVFALKKQQLADDLINDRLELRRKLESKGTDESVIQNRLSVLQNKYNEDLLDLDEQRLKAQQKITQEQDRQAKKLDAAAKRAQREREIEQSQFQSAGIGVLSAQLEKQNVLQRGVGIEFGREANIEDTIANLSKVEQFEKDILEAVFAQRRARTDSPRVLAQINEEEKIRKRIIEERLGNQRISLEQEQKSLRLARERASLELKTQLENRVEDAEFGLRQAEIIAGSPFGGQQQQTDLFNLEQERERLELIRDQSAERTRLQNIVVDSQGDAKKNAEQDLANFDKQSKRLTQILNQRQLVEQQQLRQNQLLEKYGFIADEVATAVSSSIQAIVTGTGSIEEAFSTLFQNIGRAFIDLATQLLAQKAFSAVLNALNPGGNLFGASSFNLGGFGSLAPDAGSGTSGFLTGVNFFANGGRPPVNQPSIVGEKGPELFIPDTAGTVIKNELTQKVLKGEKSIQEVLPATSITENTIQEIVPASVNLEKAIQQFIPGFAKDGRPLDSSNLQFFADGGRPPINRPSIVGERGPELFVPFQQGTIVSNEDLQEQMAKAGVSSMERSSSSRFRETREVMVPFTRSAEQLSVASAERETAQAISNPEPLDVRFESQVINNVEYVTADQYRKGMSQAAERGRALTLEALQNSVKARKRIGL